MKVQILGSDNRQQYLAEILKKRGAIITEKEVDYILLPIPDTQSYEESIMPLLKKGQKVFGCRFSKNFLKICEEKGVQCTDYMQIAAVAEKNAVATAEGAIAEALKLGVENLQKSQSLVIGYGRCGSAIAKRLTAWESRTDIIEVEERKRRMAIKRGHRVYESSEHPQIEWKKYQYIFNTVPEMVLTKKEIDKVQSDAVIVDIASIPGGVDIAYCRERQIRVKWCKGLPGIYAPKTSAYILMEAVEQS